MKEILKKALAGIKPSKEEEKKVASRIKKVMDKVKKALPETKVVLGGSGEKGTWLKDAHDADIFVMFPYARFKDKTDELSDILGKKLKKLFRIERLHGSRDYFSTRQEDFTFEIVPIIGIKKADDALNITDVSPLHSIWVKKHGKYADDIRLAKQFFKAGRVYGAESYINGFSGYICEILTIHYGGFEKLVRAIAKWKPKVIVDTEGYHKGKKVLFELDKAKTVGPLVIIDPVQAGRNAAAAVSNEKFERIIGHSKGFLKKPSQEFFEAKEISVEKLKKQAGRDELFVLEVVPKPGKVDVVGCKLVKILEHINKEIKRNDFKLLFADWEWKKKANFYFIIKKEKLGEKKVLRGPPAKLKGYVKEFRKRHKETFVEKGYVFAKEKREFRMPGELMKKAIKDKYIKEKVKNIMKKR
jgi:tRNA nucleotidyltransferase (CCA-adding enzyme)